MIEPGERSDGVGHDAGDAVVRPLTRAARRPCARPGCPAPARASLLFSYSTREAWLDRLGEPLPQAYDLCAPHAARTQPPHGWQLRDRRPADERELAEQEAGITAPIGGEQTVAVLAAALRAVPDLPEDPGAPSSQAVPDPVEAPGNAGAEDPSPVLGHDAQPTLAGGDADEPSGGEVRGHVDGDPADVPGTAAPTPKPVLAARPRPAPPTSPGARAAEW